MPLAYYSLGILFVIMAALGLAQMWFQPMSGEVFVKTIITLGVTMIIILGLRILKSDIVEDKELKKDKYLD